jgi:ATP-binding cassette subfamily C protein CydD
LGGHFLEVLQGLKTLKAFGLSQSQGRVIKAVSDQYASITLKVLRIAFLSALALEILATISTAIIAVQIGIRLLYGQIELADSLFILILAPDFYLPLRQLGAAYHSGMEGIRAAESIFKILDMPTMAKPAIPQNQKMTDDWFMGEIRFKEIQLSYQDGDRTPLKGVNFSIPAYKKTAFVGATGSGKSTIIALLLKFIQPDAGLITISGMEFREIDSSLWRKQIAWVPQFPYLFNDTVTANLLIAKPSAGPEEVIEATQKANLHDFINSLPNGYMTKIGEGGERLSGGQAQRLAIARAFLKDSPLIIFDEPTKNLDVETIGLIDETVSRLIQNKTMITAAHRLSSIQNADQIIVLEDGNVVQVGRHDELIGNEGLYRKLIYRGEVEQ